MSELLANIGHVLRALVLILNSLALLAGVASVPAMLIDLPGWQKAWVLPVALVCVILAAAMPIVGGWVSP